MVNLFLVEEADVVDGHVIIADKEKVEHLHKVLKAQVGSTIKVGMLHGPLFVGHIVELDAARARVRLEPVVGSDFNRTAQSARACVVLGTPRPTMIRNICVVAATMGVDHILMVRSERVDKSYLGCKALRPEELRENLIHGAEQGVVRQLPVVSLYPNPSIETMLRDVWPQWEQRLHEQFPNSVLVKLIAEPRMPQNLIEATAEALREAAAVQGKEPFFVLAIGPEGGWVPPEVELFKAAGFLPFHMGDKILRTETAFIALLSQVALVRSSLPWIVDAAGASGKRAKHAE